MYNRAVMFYRMKYENNKISCGIYSEIRLIYILISYGGQSFFCRFIDNQINEWSKEGVRNDELDEFVSAFRFCPNRNRTRPTCRMHMLNVSMLY